MPCLLHLDTSARPGRRGIEPHGSYTRALTDRFVTRWLRARPADPVIYRDLGATPPTPVGADWIRGAFADPAHRQPWMDRALAESNALVAELIQADVLIVGAPLYNFGMPAPLKAWVDNIVRIGLTFDFRPEQADDPYLRLLAEKPRQVVLLSARGGHGMDPGGALEHMNHLDRHLRTALAFMGIDDLHVIAVEHEEEGGELLTQSLARAQAAIDRRVDAMLAQSAGCGRASRVAA